MNIKISYVCIVIVIWTHHSSELIGH